MTCAIEAPKPRRRRTAREDREATRIRCGVCECHPDAMGHIWSNGDVVPYSGGTTMRCTNGKWVKCHVTFAEHQLDPKPCALVSYRTVEC